MKTKKVFGRKRKILLNSKEDRPAKRIPLRKFTKGGKTSFLIALGSLIIILAAIIISTVMKGKAGIYVGIMVLLALILSAAGFAIGIDSFKEENRFMRYTYIGTISNAIIWLGILGMYLIFV